MGRILRRQREGSRRPGSARNPLLDVVLGDAGVRDAIGAVTVSADEIPGVMSWASVTANQSGSTIVLNHKGPLARLQQARDHLVTALRRLGRRTGFHDLIRHPNQNGYVLLLRVPDLAPAAGFAR